MWDIALHKSHDTANAALRLYQTTLQEYREFKESNTKQSTGGDCNSSRQAPVGSPASLESHVTSVSRDSPASLGSQSSKTQTQLHCSPRSDIGLGQDTRGVSPRNLLQVSPRNLWQLPSRRVDAPPWHAPPPMQLPAWYASSPTSTGMQTGKQAGTEQPESERSPRPAYSQVHGPRVAVHSPSQASSLLPMPQLIEDRSPPSSSIIAPEPAKHQQHQQHQAVHVSPRGHFRVGPASDEAQDDTAEEEGTWRFSPHRYSPDRYVNGGSKASDPTQAAVGAPGAHTSYPALQFLSLIHI